MIGEIKRLGFQKNPDTSVWVLPEKKNFTYSDGEKVENYILHSIQKSKDRSTFSSELKGYIKDWPSLYHLSNRRANILKPFANILQGKTVLEIGCGCGALSRFLGEIGATLISVEGSYRRSQIARERCKDLENVEVVCGTSEDITKLKNFDFVILNGVLEYSTMFLGEDGPSQLLKSCHNQLKENGALILAIENRLGLKYLSGQNEDHAGKPMYGINDSYDRGEFKTWGRHELLSLISISGFKETQEYIPLPDYKLPVSIVTPYGWKNFQEELMMLAIDSVSEDPQRKSEDSFSLEMGYKNTWSNGLALELSNSFLMVAQKGDPKLVVSSNTLAYNYLDYYGKNSITSIESKSSSIIEKKYSLEDVFLTKPLESKNYLTGRNYWLELVRILNKPNWDIQIISEWAKVWKNAVIECCKIPKDSKPDLRLNSRFVDAVPCNLYFDTNGIFQFKLIDNESRGNEVFFGSVIYFGLLISFSKISTVEYSNSTYNLSFAEILLKIFLDLFQDSEAIKTIESDWKVFFESEEEYTMLKKKYFSQRNSILNYKNRIDELERNLNQIYQSFGWRIATPIRFFFTLFKKTFQLIYRKR
ncbi:MAG: class I SAM-dependent methyltransferase [Leptospiraceae bacterium]|nr:methyltransferase domain-containing protein [Leptospiraceae bacterium]MCK6380618.1 class I SAM-dependent methyltransferase [Leptospiraceae bacterium]NUM41512.1 methyltransferase domain-containing protein [Leptospiraceae bacterium]